MIKCPRCGYSEEEVKASPVAVQPPTPSVVSEYTGVKKAIPKLSERRERYLKHEYTIEDVKAPPTRLPKIAHQDNELRQFSYNGESLFFGEGVEQEL